MRELNFEIKKFWEDAGYTVSCSYPSMIVNSMVWCIMWAARKDLKEHCIAITESIGGPSGRSEETAEIMYCWDHKTYSEEEMKKLIKLKAFI